MSEFDYDVGIIGGGPAGSATAGYLAKAGLKVVVLEQELFPRFHVGESLVPSTMRTLQELGAIKLMEEAKFPRKYGASWTATASGPLYEYRWSDVEPGWLQGGVRFGERTQPGVDKDYTYHVDRSKFDHILLKHAGTLGAKVYEGVKVDRANFDDPKAPVLEFKLDEKLVKLRVRVIVDASGRKTMLGNQFRFKVNDPVFNQYALHTWFEGYDRMLLADEESQKDFIFIHFLNVTNTWVWQIPITDTVTSFGVVTQKAHFAKTKKGREEFFWECLETRPELAAALRAAKQVRPLHEEADYSYSMREICGDGFVMVGDAARFVDPIFSSGINVAFHTARLAAESIIEALPGGDFSKRAFQRYEKVIRRGTNNWHSFISMYYRLNVVFTAFMLDPKYRLSILQLLQGDVYDDDELEVLKQMREVIREVEQNPNHVWHRYLGELGKVSPLPTLATS